MGDEELHLEGILGLSSIENDLSYEEIDKYRRIPSFRRFVEEDVERRAYYLIDDKAFTKLLSDSMHQLQVHTHRFNIMIKILHTLTSNLPRLPLGKNLHTVYLKALSEPIHQSHDYREAFTIMKLWSKTELTNKIYACHSFLMNHKYDEHGKDDESTIEIYNVILEILNKLENFDKNKEIESNKEIVPKSDHESIASKRKLNRSEWQESLKENCFEKSSKKFVNPFETLRTEILDSLHEIIRKYCKSPMIDTPFHEIKYFDKINSVRRHLIGDPRAAIQSALTYPGDYLHNDFLYEVGRGEIPSELPDISIAFKLYSECGKLINLYDWFQCWLSVVKGSSATDSKEDEIDETLQARFSQAVAELQFMGFIKPSKRKTDHVSRLTWGG